jgi:hypothetical protein
MAIKSLKSASSFKLLLLFTFLITLACGLVYVTVQQSFRQSANDPQIQMAEDTARQLEAGASAQVLVGNQTIEIDKSLAPYIIIYDEKTEVVASNATLDNEPPKPPQGVFEYTKQNNQDRITWQPKAGVRSAIVMQHYNGGYVLAGRSLREVEIRENKLEKQVGGVWIVGMLGALILTAIL